jgi:hypothetical protein
VRKMVVYRSTISTSARPGASSPKKITLHHTTQKVQHKLDREQHHRSLLPGEALPAPHEPGRNGHREVLDRSRRNRRQRLAGRFQQELDGRIQVLEEAVRLGLAQIFFGENTPADGDARHPGGLSGRDVEGRVADVGGSLRWNVLDELEAIEERLGVGLVLRGAIIYLTQLCSCLSNPLLSCYSFALAGSVLP